MEKLTFKKEIKAGKAKVYDTMLGKDTYKQWTAVFSPTSDFEGSWEEGSKITFTALDKNGTKCGMIGKMDANRPMDYVAIRYLGLLEDGEEIMSGPKVDDWVGAVESYSFAENNGVTSLTVEIDCNDDWKKHFDEAWPKALDKLEELCEN